MAKTGGFCVCQICTCGRHRCPHNRGSIGQSPIKAECNFTEYKTAFERWSYQPPRKSLRPPLNAHTTSSPMDVNTVYQDTYKKHEHRNKIVKAKQEYIPSDKKMEVLSTYAKDFTGQVSVRTDSYKPEYSYVPATAKFPKDTIYRASFKNHKSDDVEWCRASPIKHKECINIESGFDLNVTSTMKEDFTKHEKPERAKLVKPIQETQQPSGKFDGNTTYKAEYTGKPASSTKSCNPRREYKANAASFFGESTAKSAYKPHTGVKREASYKPRTEYKPTNSRFDGQTTASDAYKIWPVRKPEKPTWAKRKEFESPTGHFEKTSSYQDDFTKPRRHERSQLANPGGQVPLNIYREGGPGPQKPRTQYQEHYVTYQGTAPSKSFKIIQVWDTPKEKFAGESTYRCDYKGDSTEQAKLCRPHEDMPREPSTGQCLNTTYCDTYTGSQLQACPAKGMSETSKKNGVSIGASVGNHKLVAVHEGHHIYRVKSGSKTSVTTPRRTSEPNPRQKPSSRPSSAGRRQPARGSRPSSGRATATEGPSCTCGSRPSSASAARPSRPSSGKSRPNPASTTPGKGKAKMAVVC